MKPIIIVNLKCYKSGRDALKLAKICALIKKKARIMIAPQYVDITRIAKLGIEVISQHIDPIENVKSTGHIHALAIKNAGAKGTLLNHSEYRLPLSVLKEAMKICKKVKLKTIVCTASIAKTKAILKLKPDYVAFEDPKLIATGIPISSTDSKQVEGFAKLCTQAKITPLCGAGISKGKDVKKALELGTKGVLLSSAVTTARNPRKVLTNLVS